MPRRDGPHCVSLCDDWSDPELNALVSDADDVIRHPAAGRISVELGHATAAKVSRLARRDDIRLSRRLAEQVEILTGAESESIAGDRRDDGRTSIRFGTRKHELLITTAQADAYMDALPGATRTGRYRVVAPRQPRVAVALAALLSGERDSILAPAVIDWLKVATKWSGRVGATAARGRAGLERERQRRAAAQGAREPRRAQADRAGLLAHPGRSSTGASALAELLREEPLTKVDQRALRALDWVDLHPGEPPPPALVMLTEDEESGEQELVLEEIWGIGLAGGFASLPGARDGRPAVVADPWAPDSIASGSTRTASGWTRGARELLDQLLVEHAQAEELVALSRATEADIHIDGLGGQLMPFQEAGVAYALQRRRAFIADEQGLGKTVQALAAIEADDAFPAVVVCPASLKLNWEREAKWLQHRRAVVVSGRKAVDVGDAEIVIVNYDVVGAHLSRLARLKPKALVLDESHYCKNPAAQRTKHVLELAQSLPVDALLLALTGTPLVNRPKELVPQLRILGRLREFGSGAELERRFGANAERERLHWHLRRSCYVRRLKREVLPQLRTSAARSCRSTWTTRREYRHAERDLIAWVKDRFTSSEELKSRVDSAMRAEALVRVNALRQLVGNGKLHAAHAWIHDFLTSGEKLVVFAAHRAVQRDLMERFP